MSSWLDRLKVLPFDWLLEKSCPSIQYRTLTEILDRSSSDPEVMRAREGAANFKPAVVISRAQKESGTWLDKVLEFEVPNPSRHRGPGMVNQFLALVEFGWDRTHPIIHCSAERLFRYLIEDPHADLFELKGYAGTKAAASATIRRSLAVISAALLARAGYQEEPAVMQVAERVLEELAQQYPEGGEPDLYDGLVEIENEGTYRRLRPGAHPPDMFLYYLLSFHRRFRADDASRQLLGRVTDHLMRGDDVPLRVREAEGRRFLRLVDLHVSQWGKEEFAAGRLGFLLHDLELLARTGTLGRATRARDLLEWVLSLQDEDGVFRCDAQLEKNVTRSQYHYFPLEDSWRGKHKKYTDATFRVLLILRTLDRTEPLAS